MQKPQSDEMRSSAISGVKKFFVGIVDATELLKSADEILNEIARLVWQAIRHEDAPPPVTIELLRQWISQRPDITGVPPARSLSDASTEYLEPPPADPEPEGWSEKAWYRYDRCLSVPLPT